MSIEIVKVLIFGKSPLLQSNPNREEPKPVPKGRGKGRASITTQKGNTAYDEANAGLYRTEDGKFYHPAIAFWNGLCAACPNRKIMAVDEKGKRSEKTANTVLPPAIFVAEEEAVLYDPDTLRSKKPRPLTDKDWIPDSRRINNPKVSGNPLVHRAKWRKWGAIVLFEVDTEVIPLDAMPVLIEILIEAGRQGTGCGRTNKPQGQSRWTGIGMGKYRPELP